MRSGGETRSSPQDQPVPARPRQRQRQRRGRRREGRSAAGHVNLRLRRDDARRRALRALLRLAAVRRSEATSDGQGAARCQEEEEAQRPQRERRRGRRRGRAEAPRDDARPARRRHGRGAAGRPEPPRLGHGLPPRRGRRAPEEGAGGGRRGLPGHASAQGDRSRGRGRACPGAPGGAAADLVLAPRRAAHGSDGGHAQVHAGPGHLHHEGHGRLGGPPGARQPHAGPRAHRRARVPRPRGPREARAEGQGGAEGRQGLRPRGGAHGAEHADAVPQARVPRQADLPGQPHLLGQDRARTARRGGAQGRGLRGDPGRPRGRGGLGREARPADAEPPEPRDLRAHRGDHRPRAQSGPVASNVPPEGR
mmetsp:Transcript_27367/g.82111  ORF Transcript_27367/g.82111 Transcript_27367/m.82111 type:complete len:365 (-) Transcript_27367:29-1123(-)